MFRGMESRIDEGFATFNEISRQRWGTEYYIANYGCNIELRTSP
jgi:hypothetical protein